MKHGAFLTALEQSYSGTIDGETLVGTVEGRGRGGQPQPFAVKRPE